MALTVPSLKSLVERLPVRLQSCQVDVRGFLNAVQQLWTVLREEAGFRFLSLRRLNQDCLENIFGTLRQLNACNLNSTCPQWESSLKTATINNLASYKPRGANCELDNDSLLSDLRTLLRDKDTSQALPQVLRASDRSATNLRLREVPRVCREEETLTGLRRQPSSYVCGFIAKRLLYGEVCEDCKKSLVTHDYTEDHLFISLKEYDVKQEHLQYPTTDMVNVIEALLHLFQTNISDIIYLCGVKAKLIKNFKENVDFQWLRCSKHKDSLVYSTITS